MTIQQSLCCRDTSASMQQWPFVTGRPYISDVIIWRVRNKYSNHTLIQFKLLHVTFLRAKKLQNLHSHDGCSVCSIEVKPNKMAMNLQSASVLRRCSFIWVHFLWKSSPYVSQVYGCGRWPLFVGAVEGRDCCTSFKSLAKNLLSNWQHALYRVSWNGLVWR